MEKLKAMWRKREALPEGLTHPGVRKTVWKLAAPSLAENFLTSLASMVDMMMVGGLGTWAITSVGLTTQPKFLLMAVFIALNTGATAIVARAKGAGNRAEANKAMRQSILLTGVLTLIISTVGYFASGWLVQLMGAQEEATLAGGTVYLQIQMLGFPFLSMSMAVSAVLRGVGNTRSPMIYNMVANVVNIILNYCLIEGNLGFPAMGLAGASLATIIGQFIAFLMAYTTVIRGDHYLTLKRNPEFKQSFKPDFVMIGRIANVGVPAMLEQLVMRAGMMIFSILVANLGTDPYAIHQICMNLLQLTFMNGMAFGVAATTLTGQSLGAKRPDYAQTYSHYCRRYGMFVAIGIALMFFLFGDFFVRLYDSNPHIIAGGKQILMIAALIQPLQASQLIIAGALRGAGDTRVTAIIVFVGTLIIRPIFAFLAVNVLGWGVMGAWIAMMCDQTVRSVLVLLRFNTGKWKTLKV